jgi:SAM-dependent methyltransferase
MEPQHLLPDSAASAPNLGLSFAGVADAYDRGRPPYPADAAAWLLGRARSLVLELGAGTGKFTEQVLGLGHEVVATDPLREMAQFIPSRAPRALVALARAEELPVAGRSVDTVVCAQAFHWFDHARALPEIARVLRPGGNLALVWNVRDNRIPWVKRLGKLIGNPEDMFPKSLEPLEECEWFGPLETETFRIWQPLRRNDLHDLVLSRSAIAVLPEHEQREKLREADALYDEYGRGPDGMLLPYLTHCYRAPLIASPPPRRALQTVATSEPETAGSEPAEVGPTIEPSPQLRDTDDGHVLIDFR